MELKLLRLEAKVAQRDQPRQQRRQPNTASGGTTNNITDRLPPISATASTPNQSDEEVDSFEELELTPRGTNRQGSGLFTRGMGPATNITVTRSGASVASAVTQEGLTVNEDERSDDGDIEDEGEDDNDGSTSSEYYYNM